MKEIRITFRGEDFAAVSQSMIELGVSFRVEPFEADENEAPAVVAHSRKAVKAKPTKRSRAASQASAPQAVRGGEEGAGAARLRAMIERNRAAAARPPAEGDRDETSGGEQSADESP